MHLRNSLLSWLQQDYNLREILIVDYSGPNKQALPVVHQWMPFITYLPLQQENGCFNMSHALNYGIARARYDIIHVSGVDVLPCHNFLSVVMSHLKPKQAVLRSWGGMSFTRKMWSDVNGYQEFIDTWGGEDDDFRERLKLAGYDILNIGSFGCQVIQHSRELRKEFRRPIPQGSDEVADGEGNRLKLKAYRDAHGYVANWGHEVGQEKPCGIE